MKVYLAGPIDGLTHDETVGWRFDVSNRLEDLGYTCFSPMRGKGYLKDAGVLYGSYDAFPMSTAQGLFRRDCWDVSQADVVLANLDDAKKVSIGSCMEIMRAYDLGKYIVTVMKPGDLHDHPFIRQASSVVVHNLDDAMHILAVLAASS